MKRVFFCLSVAVFSNAIAACDEPDPDVSSEESELTSTRHLPFLPGQRMGILQGVNGATSHFGDSYYGIDFSLSGTADHGIPIVAVDDGIVNSVIYGMTDGNHPECNYGNTVVYCNNFQAGSDTCERAGHLREVFVKPGERVKRGQVIGLLGTSGWSTGPHLHSQLQSVFSIGSVASSYTYKATETGSTITGTWNSAQTCTSTEITPCAISINDGVMGTKAATLTSAQTGSVIDPRALASMEQNEGWQGYGWYSSHVSCTDTSADSNITCSNESSFRENTYIRRYSGGTNVDTAIVYDALSGALDAYVIRSGFLKNVANGWDALGGPHADIGMPIEDQRTTATGAEQCFQWGILRWTSSTNAVTAHQYPSTISSSKSIGPGVFKPDGHRKVHYWNRDVSYRFVNAWNRNGGRAALGFPVSDNQASPGVHDWSGTRFLIQNFEGGSLGPAAIMYDPLNGEYAAVLGTSAIPSQGWNRAYVIRMGFWEWYRYNNGISRMKTPLSDEYAYGSGARQDFLCGWLEWNSGTQSVIPHENPSAPGCSNITPIPRSGADSCYGPSTPLASELSLDTGGGSGPGPMTIVCNVGPADMSVEITGPIQNGVFTQVSGSPIYVEYGSDTDGWSPYTTGKPKQTWIGDTLPVGDPRTYSFILGNSVQNMNFFLYNPSNGQQGWFDLDDWTVVGDCWRDAGGIRHFNPSASTASGSLTCSLDSTALTININGPVQSLLVSGAVSSPTKILYGSDTDGWTVPYSSGKAFATWNGSNSHTLVLPPNVYNFNLYLTNGSTGKWFDLTDADLDSDSWTVGGACWKNGGVITHAAPPNGTINCVENGPDMTVTVTGNIPSGIFGSVPSGSPVYLEYGSDTDGWSPYTTGKPKATWSTSTTNYSLILSNSVQNMNFFLYGPSSGQSSWFNLNNWNVTGDCWRDGGGIRH